VQVQPLLVDTFLMRTVHLVPAKCPYILFKNNHYNTHNGHEISAPKRKSLQTEPLYYGHSNCDSCYSTRFPVCRYISKCNQLSHRSHDNSIICFQFVSNTLLYISVRYTCYCFITLLFGNCIIVSHRFLELYSLYCPLNN